MRGHNTDLILLGRITRADESDTLFLACAEASFITEAELPVYGGMAQV